ncbi:formylglycine-generating enzyme family protein [Acidobacteriota bacterium]
MLDVPAGTFTMGRRDDGDDGIHGQDDELPRHQVILSAYRIGKYEVTNRQYCDVMNWAQRQGYLEDSTGGPYSGGDVYYNGNSLLRVTRGTCQISYTGGIFTWKSRDGYSMEDHPVVEISWHGAVAFLNWLSVATGMTPAYDLSTWELVDADPGMAGVQFTNGFRLPTEAEWERAAAWDGSTHWIYSMVSDTLTGWDRANYRPDINTKTNPLGLTEEPFTSPVGWFNGINISPNMNVQTVDSPSPVGAYDMTGNVWEWCHDWYDHLYYGGGSMIDPTGPPSGIVRVGRSGSWNGAASGLRSANRYNRNPTAHIDDLGLRVAAIPSD